MHVHMHIRLTRPVSHRRVNAQQAGAAGILGTVSQEKLAAERAHRQMAVLTALNVRRTSRCRQVS